MLFFEILVWVCFHIDLGANKFCVGRTKRDEVRARGLKASINVGNLVHEGLELNQIKLFVVCFGEAIHVIHNDTFQSKAICGNWDVAAILRKTYCDDLTQWSRKSWTIRTGNNRLYPTQSSEQGKYNDRYSMQNYIHLTAWLNAYLGIGAQLKLFDAQGKKKLQPVNDYGLYMHTMQCIFSICPACMGNVRRGCEFWYLITRIESRGID